MDINDHAPTFLHASPLHTISVEENVRVGFELGRLYAVDEDGGRNGEVRYRLEVESDNVTRLFEIDELTGVLRTTEELDREQTDVYNMKVSIFGVCRLVLLQISAFWGCKLILVYIEILELRCCNF